MLHIDLSTVIAVLSFIFSVATAWFAWRYNGTAVRYTARNQYMNALFDLDRQLIARPELWAIHDDHPMVRTRSHDPEAAARREAFIYLHLNLFESVYNDYHKSLRPNRTDAQHWASWD